MEERKHKHHTGDHVKVNHDGPSTAKGKTKGTVKSVHYGPYYGVHTGRGMVWMPQTHVEPVPTPPVTPPPEPTPTASLAGDWVRRRLSYVEEVVALLQKR